MQETCRGSEMLRLGKKGLYEMPKEKNIKNSSVKSTKL